MEQIETHEDDRVDYGAPYFGMTPPPRTDKDRLLDMLIDEEERLSHLAEQIEEAHVNAD